MFPNSTLANCEVTLLDCHVVGLDSLLVNSTILFFYFAKFPSPLHPVDCPKEVQAAHKTKNFWALWPLNVLSDVLSLGSRKSHCPCDFCFFHRRPRAPPSIFPSSFSSLLFYFFFDLIDLWSLRGALSNLKFTPKISFENNEWAWLVISCFFLNSFLWVVCTWIIIGEYFRHLLIARCWKIHNLNIAQNGYLRHLGT